MAITCTLGRDNIIKLLDAVYKKMLTTPAGEIFDVNQYINYMYSGFEKAQGRDTAIQYIQQIPYIIGSVEAQLGGDLTLNMSIEKLREVTRSFRNADTGLDAIEKYLGIAPLTPEQLAAKANYKANTPVGNTSNPVDPDAKIEETELKARTIFSGTGQEFETQDPTKKTKTTVERLDKDNTRTYNTISRIHRTTFQFDTTLGNPVYQGQELTLIPIALSRMPDAQMTKQTSDLLKRMNSIEAQRSGTGKVTLPSEVFMLVISDKQGKPLYFDDDGNITTKEKGKYVYQTLRDIRQDSTGKYIVTNMYGIENKIIEPAEEARLRAKEMGYKTPVEFKAKTGKTIQQFAKEIEAEQQRDAKQLYELRQKLIKGENFILPIIGASQGVSNTNIKNLTLNQLESFYAQESNSKSLSDLILGNIQTLNTPAYGFDAGDTIIKLGTGVGRILKLDRSDIQSDLAMKIAEVLTSDNLSPTKKFEFYTQFYAKEITNIPNSTRRHQVYFDETNNIITFEYYTFTGKQVELDNITINPSTTLDLNDTNLTKKNKDQIFEILTKGKTSVAGFYYPAKFDYNQSLLSLGTYSDYVDGEFVEKNYIDFLRQQDGQIFLSKEGVPLFNAYIKFSPPTGILSEITNEQSTEKDTRSEVRIFKDNLVEVVLFADPKSITAEVTKVFVSNEDQIVAAMKKGQKVPEVYSLDVKIDGQEGTHRVYGSTAKANIGDKLYLEVSDVVINGFIIKDTVKLLTEVDGNIIDMGSLAETDFKNKEARREAIPVQTVIAENTAEDEAIESVKPFSKTVTENQAKAGDVNITNPPNTSQPDDSSDISNLIDDFELGRSASLPNGVTTAQVERAIEWWNNSPLSQYIKLIQAANIVNSDVYAKFVASGAKLITDMSLDLDGKMGAILINPTTGGTMVDTYHEAWHVFSQLFLTKAEKTALYNEVRKLKPEYAKLSARQVEEMLAEDFRSYALNPKVIKGRSKRNTLFRKILNFLKKLFRIKPSTADLIKGEELATEGVAGELFQNLYFASKNPKLLNNYTPLISNVALDELNRGIEQINNNEEDALNDMDSDLVIETMDSLLATVIDNTYEKKSALDAALSIISNENNKSKFFNFARNRFLKDIENIQGQLNLKPNVSFNSFETLQNLEDNAIAIIRSSKGKDTYIFLKGQVEDFTNLNLATEAGERTKGELYKGNIDIIGDYYNHKTIKSKDKDAVDIIIVNSIDEAQAQFDAYKNDTEASFTDIELYHDRTIDVFEVDYDQAALLDSLRILQLATDNWENVLKYFKEKSSYNIITKTVRIQESDPENDTQDEDAQLDVTKSQKFDKGSDVNLLEIVDKEVVFILKSLFAVKKDSTGKPVFEYNKLGYKKLANYKKVWNAVVRATNSNKDPRQMFKNIQDSVAIYPELEQLIKYRLPNPQLILDENTSGNPMRSFDIVTSFWSVFSLPRLPYMQLTVFRNQYETFDGRGNSKITSSETAAVEITNASTDIGNTIRKFEASFAARLDSAFTRRDADNNTILKLDSIVQQFSDRSGNFKFGSEFLFLNALGFNLDDIGKIKEELIDPNNSKFFGVNFIFDTIRDLNNADKAGSMTDAARRILDNFRKNPITTLKKGIDPGVIGLQNSFIFTKGSKQTSQIDRIINLQNKLGSTASTFSVQNPEKNRVNEHVNDSSLTIMTDAMNTAVNRTDMYRFGSTARHLDPSINPFAESSLSIKSLFLPEGSKRPGRSIKVEMLSGTQTINTIVSPNGFVRDGAVTGSNTTSLDKRGKFIQDIHTFLKTGRVELMRPGSKNSSFSWRIDNGIATNAIGKIDKHLYIDINSLEPNKAGEADAIEGIIIPYLSSELKRINIYNESSEAKNYVGYNREFKNGKTYGESFVYFDGILTENTQNEILEKVKNPSTKLQDYLKTDPELAKKINDQIKEYFKNRTNQLTDYLKDAKFIDKSLMDRLKFSNLNTQQKETTLIKAFLYNYWVHNVETSILFLGDLAQYDHRKQELHKRISGLISNGPRIRTDVDAQLFSNELGKSSYAASLPSSLNITPIIYKGYVNTVIMKEVERDSIYLDVFRKGLTEDYERRYNTRNIPNKEALIKERVKKEIDKYKGIKEADGQGYITFDAYRLFKKLQNKWSDPQENLYQKVVKGEDIKASEIIEMFPVYKLQNFGFVENTVLPVTAMHKFALMPIIPGVFGTEMDSLHTQMMQQNVHYATFESGSKVGHIAPTGSKADIMFKDNAQTILKEDIKFTINTINAAFLKEAASVNSKYKGESVFSTQLRALVTSGLYNQGKLVNNKNAPIVNTYNETVDFYTELLKYELYNQIEYNKDGNKLVGKPDKFLKLIRENLERKDYPPHLLKQLQTNTDGTLKGDLSYFIDRKTIEKTILSIVEKRFVRQYVNGEPLVQVASTFGNGLLNGGPRFEKPTDAQIKKFLGTNNLPFYHPGENGNTNAMKVAIALQGNFEYLLNIKHIDGKPIENILRLNSMIKNEKWLDTEDNRKKITIAAVRIPVQGLNSMEFMEVYEFLDPTASNLIILPTEIVTKSGGDYDVDKLTTFFPNIDKNGNLYKSTISNKDFITEANKIKDKQARKSFIKQQKFATQNQFIDSIRSILELPENFASLIRPNDTYILKDLADKLQDDVTSYDKFTKHNGEINMVGDKKIISPTTTLEPLYNLSKHEENLVGKAVLGIAASENKLSPMFDAAGGKMPLTYKATVYNNGRYIVDAKNPADYEMRLNLRHNKIGKHISISDILSADGVNIISDIYSQGMNGWLDVEKDEWIFYIQGNYEIAPTFLYLIKAGVPVRDAVYFVSQPMIREYAEQQRLLGGDYGAILGIAPSESQFTRFQSARDVVNKYTARYLYAIMDGVRPDQKFNVEFRPIDNYTDKSKPIRVNVSKRELAIEIQKGIIDPLEIMRIYQDRGPKKVDIYFAPDLRNKLYYDATGFALNKAERVDGNFSVDLMQNIIEGKKNINDLSNKEVIAEMGMFLHFYEIQKQLMGLSAMKRLLKPDTKTFSNFQQIYLEDINRDLLDENSKIDQETKEKLFKESIVSSLFDKSIITDVAAPMMDLVNNVITNKAIKEIITTKDISSFGVGQDGVVSFIDSYKDAIVNFIYQNYLSNFVDARGNLITVPENYRGVKVTNNKALDNDAVYTDQEITINLENIKRDYKQKVYLVNSDAGTSYKERNGLKPFNSTEDPFATEEQYIRYVIERAYQQTQGLTDLQLNQVSLINVYNPAALTKNSEYSYTKMVLDVIDEFPGLKAEYPVLEQLSARVSRDSYLLTLNDRDVADGTTKSQYATNIRALGNSRIQKVKGDANARISAIFSVLPKIAVYQHGNGVTPFGLELIIPQETVIAATKNAGDLFKINYWNQETLNLIYDKLVSVENNRKLFKNFLVSPIQISNPANVRTVIEPTVDPENIASSQIIQPTQSSTSVEPTEPTEPTSPDDELFGLDISNQQNLEFQTQTLNQVFNFLDAVGIEQRLVPEILSANGSVVDNALAVANFMQGTVDIIDQFEKRPLAWNKLPEEAAHFWYRLLKADSPLKKALWDAHETSVKNNELYRTQYGNLVNSPEDLTEESIGQLIAEAIKRLETKESTPEDQSFFTKFINLIKRILGIYKQNKNQEDIFEVAAIKILNSDLSDLMTWQEYLELSNQAFPDTAITKASIDPVDYAYFQDNVLITTDEDGNNFFAVQNSPLFATVEELDYWVYANTSYAEDYKRVIQEIQNQKIFVDRLLNRTYKKKTRYLRKTIDKLFNIHDKRTIKLIDGPNVAYGAYVDSPESRFNVSDLELTEKLTSEEKKNLEQSRNYSTITPTLKALPQILAKYKKNPISLSEKLKVDGVKKEELALLQNVIDAIKAENPSKRSITAQEFVNEAYMFLEANYMLGYANEQDHLNYRINEIFNEQRLPSGDPVLHQKISLRFNDTYYKIGRHFQEAPSAFASLTLFPQNKKGDLAVLLHEIQNDQIETLREGTIKLENYTNPLESYLEELEKGLERARKKAVQGNLDVSKTNPLDNRVFKNPVYRRVVENKFTDNSGDFTRFMGIYKNDQIYLERPEQYTDQIRFQNDIIDQLYINMRIFKNVQASGGIEQFISDSDRAIIEERIIRSNEAYDPRADYTFPLEVYNRIIEKIKAKYPNFDESKIEYIDVMKSLIPDYAPRTNKTKLNTSMNYFFKVVAPQKLNNIINKKITSAKQLILTNIKGRNKAYFVDRMLKLTLDEYKALVNNINYNYNELDRLKNLATDKAIEQRLSTEGTNIEELISDLEIEAETARQTAEELSSKQAGAIEGAKINLEKLLSVELNYFMPLVHQVLQTHIRQYGKSTPLYFSGSDITMLTQGGTGRIAQIYAGPEEVKYSKAETDIIKFQLAYDADLTLNRTNYNIVITEDSVTSDPMPQDELDFALKALTEAKKNPEINNRIINTQVAITKASPITVGAIYTMLSKVPGVSLVYQSSIEGIQGNPGGYLVDLTNYNFDQPLLFGLDLTASQKKEQSYPTITFDKSNQQKIMNGTKIITNRVNDLKGDSQFFTMDNGAIVKVTYLGEAIVNNKTDVVTITNNKTGLKSTRTLDQFAKAEGFKSAADFKKNNLFSANFINRGQIRQVYQIQPVNSIANIPAGSISSEENPEINEFNTYLEENSGIFPKEFNPSNGRRYLLNDNNLYDLVSPDGKTMYLRNMDLRTGIVEQVPEVIVPATEKRKEQAIKDIREMIKLMNLDFVIAEDGYNIFQLMEDIKNATTMSEIERIEKIIRKYTC